MGSIVVEASQGQPEREIGRGQMGQVTVGLAAKGRGQGWSR